MARRMSSFFSKKKSTDADQPPPPATNDDADQRVVAEDAEVAEAEPVSELAAREDAKSRKRALVFIAVFWMDNIFTAFVADAMAEVFPFTYKRGKWTAATILALIGYDVFNTAFSVSDRTTHIHLPQTNSESLQVTAPLASPPPPPLLMTSSRPPTRPLSPLAPHRRSSCSAPCVT